MNLTSPLSPPVAVQRAAQRAVMDGFTVTTSDATGGILTATLTKQGGGDWGPYVTCRFPEGSIAHQQGSATLTLRMTAQANGTGSTVFLAASSRFMIPTGVFATNSADDCASSGAIEKELAAALATP